MVCYATFQPQQVRAAFLEPPVPYAVSNYKTTTPGYPIATLPLSYLDFNGRPFGLVALASAHQDALLVQVQSAWEATFPRRKPPPMFWDGPKK